MSPCSLGFLPMDGIAETFLSAFVIFLVSCRSCTVPQPDWRGFVLERHIARDSRCEHAQQRSSAFGDEPRPMREQSKVRGRHVQSIEHTRARAHIQLKNRCFNHFDAVRAAAVFVCEGSRFS